MVNELSDKYLDEIEAEVKKALGPIGEKFGVDLAFKGGSFDKREATLKLNVKLLNSTHLTREEEAYDFYEPLKGLPPRGSIIQDRKGRDWKLVGYRTKCSKYPIVCEEMKSRNRARFTISTVKVLAQKDGLMREFPEMKG